MSPRAQTGKTVFAIVSVLFEGVAKEMVFIVIFCIFVVIGASMNLGPVIDFSDAMIFTMAIFNIAGLYLLMPKVKEILRDYQARLASGEFPKIK